MGNWKKNQGRWVQISIGPRGSIRFTGTSIVTDGSDGTLKERQIRISSKAPAWFHRICLERANTDFLIRVRVAGLFQNSVAYVLPCAESEDAAIAEWAAMHPEVEQDKIKKQEQKKKLAEEAHSLYAKKHGMTVLMHLHTPLRLKTTALDLVGREVEIKGGTVVSHHIDGLSRKEFDLNKLIELYVRHNSQSIESRWEEEYS